VRHRYGLSKLHAHAGAHSAEICSKDCTGARGHAPDVGVGRTVEVRDGEGGCAGRLQQWVAEFAAVSVAGCAAMIVAAFSAAISTTFAAMLTTLLARRGVAFTPRSR
jgi:hypothetical protein